MIMLNRDDAMKRETYFYFYSVIKRFKPSKQLLASA